MDDNIQLFFGIGLRVFTPERQKRAGCGSGVNMRGQRDKS